MDTKLEGFKKKYHILFSLLILLLLNSACTSFGKRIEGFEPGQSKAETLLINFKKKNHNLKTFKGIGKINLTQNQELISARMAFLGSKPSSLRIEVLSPTGQPTLSFSAHKETIYFISHFENSFFKKRSKNANLKHLLSIQLNVSDVINLLSGRIPILNYHSCELAKNEQKDGWVLILKKRWSGVCEKIYLDENQAKIYKVEIFSSRGVLKYRAVFEGSIFIDNFEIPKTITITDNKNTLFNLRIDTYVANIEAQENVYILMPKEKQHTLPN